MILSLGELQELRITDPNELPPLDQTLVFIGESDGVDLYALVCPDTSPDHRRLVIATSNGIYNFKIHRGPAIIHSGDCFTHIAADKAWNGVRAKGGVLLPKESQFSQVHPSLDHFGDFIASNWPLILIGLWSVLKKGGHA